MQNVYIKSIKFYMKSKWNQNVLFLFISMKYSNALNSVKSIGGFNVKFRVIEKNSITKANVSSGKIYYLA